MIRLLARALLSLPLSAVMAAAQPAVHPPEHKPSATPARAVPAAHAGRPAVRTHVKPPAPAPAPPQAPTPAPEADKDPEPTKGSNTGSPLPRYAALRSDEVNLRPGPGTRYPIDWVYKRRDLPVLIEREFDAWRLVRDPEGVKGWVNQATLAPRRTGVVVGGEQVLRGDPKVDAAAVARLKAGVIVRLRSCEATSDWCQASVQDYRGWVRRTDVWGVFPGEAIQ